MIADGLEVPGVKEGDILEAKVNSRWVKCPAWTWRSWTGPRRVNGELYTGPVFFLGSSIVSRP